MNWKFWKKNDDSFAGARVRKLPRPKDLPIEIGKYLVVESGFEPDWIWSLKSAACPKAGSPTAYDIRIFDNSTANEKGITIKNYDTLNEFPELVVFEGWFDKDTQQFQLEKK